MNETTTSGFLIDRLASSIVDESLPLKEIERELRGAVADVAVRQRGLKKKELASRCGVTEKSVENYLKETRNNPKSPDREVARVLQDQTLSLEEVHDAVFPILSQERNLSLDDVKRSIDRLVSVGEIREVKGKRYRANPRPAICCPLTPDAFRSLVDQKARDLDYIILRQNQVRAEELDPERLERFSRVVGDTNLVRIDFTVDVNEEDLPDFYEKLTEQIAKLTMKFEKKKGKSRLRLILGMRSVVAIVLACLLVLAPAIANRGQADDSWELDRDPADSWELDRDPKDSWELDFRNEGDTGDGGPRHGLPEVVFLRGDANSDATVDVSDALGVLRFLFLHEPIACADAADADDSGVLEITDPLEILSYLYAPTWTPRSSLGAGPVTDDTADELGCDEGL